jgi:hypothetical protein
MERRGSAAGNVRAGRLGRPDARKRSELRSPGVTRLNSVQSRVFCALHDAADHHHSAKEWEILRSQIVTLRTGHGRHRK